MPIISGVMKQICVNHPQININIADLKQTFSFFFILMRSGVNTMHDN